MTKLARQQDMSKSCWLWRNLWALFWECQSLAADSSTQAESQRADCKLACSLAAMLLWCQRPAQAALLNPWIELLSFAYGKGFVFCYGVQRLARSQVTPACGFADPAGYQQQSLGV